MANSNPVFGSNRLKLGIFAINGKPPAMSDIAEAQAFTWPVSLSIALQADEAGYEAVVPYARWKGYIAGDHDHVSGIVLDPLTWAAAIAQATKRIGVFATTHAPTIHPALAAKQAATVDIISGGRFALNVVGGWNRPELEMFGAPLREHDQRYDQLAEWLEVLQRLWTEESEFDFEGHFYRITKGWSRPTPLQRPRIPIMNAGGSERGRRFACEHADLCFVLIKSDRLEDIQREVQAYKDQALTEFGRHIQVWTIASVVQRETEKEANAFLRYFAVERQDQACVDAWMRLQGAETQLMSPEALEGFRLRFAAGAGGYLLVGDAELIAERLNVLSEAGVDGVLLTWADYVDGLQRFTQRVLPKLEQRGLRQSFNGAAKPSAAVAATT